MEAKLCEAQPGREQVARREVGAGAVVEGAGGVGGVGHPRCLAPKVDAEHGERQIVERGGAQTIIGATETWPSVRGKPRDWVWGAAEKLSPSPWRSWRLKTWSGDHPFLNKISGCLLKSHLGSARLRQNHRPSLVALFDLFLRGTHPRVHYIGAPSCLA